MFSFFKTGIQKIKGALKKTHSLLFKRLSSLFSKPLSPETIEELEQTLYEADLGSKNVIDFISHIERFHKQNPKASQTQYLQELQSEAERILSQPPAIEGREGSPQIILVVGVNGSGKTTSIGKLAHLFQKEGKKVLLAAGDTFRAAAVEQLETFAKRLNIDIVKSQMGSDPSSVLYDAMSKAKAKGYDVVICDTAGRLESKTDLMHELQKVDRVAKKLDANAPHEIYFTVDAKLGQTAIEQARIFGQYTHMTGLILTKVDGSAKGGMALAIYRELKVPIRYLCFGETVESIEHFDAKSYAEALFQE